MDPRLVHDDQFKPDDIVTWRPGPKGQGPSYKRDLDRVIEEYGRGPFIVESVAPVPEYRWCDTGHRQYVRVRRGKVLITEWTGTDRETPKSISGAWFEHG